MSNTKQKLGVIIGRFQPMHNGHVALIKKSMETCEKTLVLIGSTNKAVDFRNPLTVDERLDLIEEAQEGWMTRTFDGLCIRLPCVEC